MKKFCIGFDNISEEAFCMLCGTLKTCCAMVLCSFMLLVHMGDVSARCFSQYMTALELALSPVGILLVGGIASVILEDLRGR